MKTSPEKNLPGMTGGIVKILQHFLDSVRLAAAGVAQWRALLQLAEPALFLAIIGGALLISGPQSMCAQTVNGTDGYIPTAIAPGTPGSSYALNHLVSLNYFTGNLNINVPLLTVGGRGEASMQLGVVIDSNRYIQDEFGASGWCPTLGGSCHVYYVNSVAPTPSWTTNGAYTYAGWMEAKYADNVIRGEASNAYAITRLYFYRPDGTATELVDANYYGQPVLTTCNIFGGSYTSACNQMANRGSIFVSHDGSQLQFQSDADIHDVVNFGSQSGNVTGTLYFPTGVKYRIQNGAVTSITDRNGNMISIGTGSITDSLGRSTQITKTTASDYNSTTTTFTYTGYRGKIQDGTRTITVQTALLSQNLASGYSIQPRRQVYPNLYGALNESAGTDLFDMPICSTITLADGSQYHFKYNSNGELARMELPTGGAYEFTWASVNSYYPDGIDIPLLRVDRGVIEVREYPDGSSLGRREVISYSGSPSSQTTSDEYDGSGNHLRSTVHSFYVLENYGHDPLQHNSWKDGLEYQTDIYADGGYFMKRVSNTWQQKGSLPWSDQGNPYLGDADTQQAYDQRVVQTDTTIESGQMSRVTLDYDSFNNVTDRKEYDFGQGSPGSLLRDTQTTYMTGACVDPAVHIVNLPLAVWVYDGSNNLYSFTQYTYDDYGNPNTPLYNCAGIIGHDNQNFGGAGSRGNVTTIGKRYLEANVWLNTYLSYDIAGNLRNVTDPNGNATAQAYDDNYSDGQNRHTYAYRTTVTNAAGQKSTYQYDFNSGRPVSVKDINGAATPYIYDDKLDRLTQKTLASGAYISYNYPSSVEVDTKSDQSNVGDQALVTKQIYDGFGRVTETDQLGDSNQYIATTKTYNALGLVLTTTNPSRPGDGLNFTTTYQYDPLGRTTQVTTPDGSTVATSYYGNTTTVTDQRGHERELIGDVLGRVTDVYEDLGGSNFHTQYVFDVSNNLRQVTQGSQTRSFVYDSVNRLTTATNPETGVISYSYYPNGNLQAKTDARNVTTTYTYDALNHLTGKSYSDGTPAVTYTYGTDPTDPLRLSRLTSVTNGVSTTNYLSYDLLGQVKSSQQVTNGQTYNFAYGYDLAGSLTSETYPSGRVISTQYDAAERVSAVNGTMGTTATPYISGVAYWPHGEIYHFDRANKVSYAAAYNSRLQPVETYESVENSSSGFLAFSCLNWGTQQPTDSLIYNVCPSFDVAKDNGNLWGRIDYAGGPGAAGSLSGFSEDFSYDGLDRLIFASDSGGWTRTFNYDQYGNMWVDPGQTTGIAPAGNTPIANVFNNNQIGPSCNQPGTAYDCAGNQLSVNGDSIAYDAENRQISATEPLSSGGAKETYLYDGDGRRVEKIGPSGTTVFVYDVQGRMVAEYSTFGQGSIACSTCYLSWDHLGTTRMVTDQKGQVIARHDYLPFGEEIGANAGRNSQWAPTNDNINQKFTGQYRDTNADGSASTGLDYFGARYYGSALGRFTSPDAPFADQNTADPQSWNLYSYVRNNPLNRTDPNGRLTVIIPGTFWSPSNWNANMKLLNEARQKFHDPDVRILNWSGSATVGARMDAVQSLDQMVANHTFAPGEQLNIIGHSRGGDVAIDASNSISHKIDNLITLDSPGYYLTDGNMANIGTWINVSVDQDWVISLFSDDASKSRNEPGANNLHLSAPQYGYIAAHTAVWQDNQLRNLWWRYWQDHAGCQESWDDKTNTLHGCQ